ncbi:MAG TPA: hypothetical protein VGD38_15860 [Pyrinomonadaceae bacterium]
MIKTGNVSSVFGRWLNTNRDTPTIAECTVSQDKDGIAVQVIGADKEPWPIARPTVLANLEEEAGQRSVALMAKFDLGHMMLDTHMRVNKGVFVIVVYATFKDGSGRSNHLYREFFYRSE